MYDEDFSYKNLVGADSAYVADYERKYYTLLEMIDMPNSEYSDAMLYYYAGEMVFDIISDPILYNRSYNPLSELNDFLSCYTDVVDNGPLDFQFEKDIIDDAPVFELTKSLIIDLHKKLNDSDFGFDKMEKIDIIRKKAQYIYNFKLGSYEIAIEDLKAVPKMVDAVEESLVISPIVDTVIEKYDVVSKSVVENDNKTFLYVTPDLLTIADIVVNSELSFTIVDEDRISIDVNNKYIMTIDKFESFFKETSDFSKFIVMYDKKIEDRIKKYDLFQSVVLNIRESNKYIDHDYVYGTRYYVDPDIYVDNPSLTQVITMLREVKEGFQSHIFRIPINMCSVLMNSCRFMLLPPSLFSTDHDKLLRLFHEVPSSLSHSLVAFNQRDLDKVIDFRNVSTHVVNRSFSNLKRSRVRVSIRARAKMLAMDFSFHIRKLNYFGLT